MVKKIIIFIFIGGLIFGGALGCASLAAEHEEARNVSLDGADFSALKDGTYIGEYEGGMYGWRANKVRITIAEGTLVAIELLDSSEADEEDEEPKLLFQRVVEAQSLEVDGITGATLTTRAYLKAVEQALIESAE